jgi:hypothetical protein
MTMAMANFLKKHGEYIAYMLRLWPVRNKTKQVWRASLEDAHTGERVGFASLDELFGYLRQQTGVEAKPEEPEQ